jgi:hypothetical protein
MRWTGRAVRVGNSPLGRFKCRWVDNVKMVVREKGWGVRDWIHLAQDRDKWKALVNTVMNPRFP